jgi:short-subunit dehydrogenase
MKKAFQDKIAIVTGASSGIGRETALALAERGAHVVLAGRRVKALEHLYFEIQGKGREALVVPTDVTLQEQVEALVETTLSKWGQVDILVSNAGQYIRSPVMDLSIDILKQSMAVNFYAHVYTFLAVLPTMVSQNSGHIVVVATLDAKTPLYPDAPYVAAKSALSGLTHVLRQELYDTNVNASIIYPGRVDTPMIEDLKFHWLSAKISPQSVAHAIIQAIQKNKAQVIVPPHARLLEALYFFTPALADWAARYFNLKGWRTT